MRKEFTSFFPASMLQLGHFISSFPALRLGFYTIVFPGSQAFGFWLNHTIDFSWISSLQMTNHGTSQTA